MIKNFDEVKKQLSDLSSIINAFKSEAVQLRIVELIFKQVPHELTTDPSEGADESSKSKPTRRRKVKGKKEPRTIEKKTSRPGKHGPITVLEELIKDGFFKEKRTLKAIIDYCAKKKARNFRQSDLSGPLGRFVRDQKLDRDKNQDGQYEYFTK